MTDETSLPLNDISVPTVSFKSESTLPKAANVPEPTPEAPKASDTEQTDTEAEADSVTEADAPAKETKSAKKPWFQDRIDKLTWEKHERERELERLKAELAVKDVTKPAGDRPKLEDFDFDTENYTQAVAEWTVKRVKEAERQEQAKAQEAQARESQATAFQQRIAEFEERMPGAWQKAVTADMPVPPELQEIVQARPAGLELAAYLADNLEEAREIASLSPTLRAAEYALIERSLRTESTAKVIPPKPPVTRAPPPVPTLKPKAPVQVPLDKETPEDRIRRWKSEGAFKKHIR